MKDIYIYNTYVYIIHIYNTIHVEYLNQTTGHQDKPIYRFWCLLLHPCRHISMSYKIMGQTNVPAPNIFMDSLTNFSPKLSMQFIHNEYTSFNHCLTVINKNQYFMSFIITI